MYDSTNEYVYNGTNGIGVADISKALKFTSGDISILYRKGSIKVNSWKKPCRSPLKGGNGEAGGLSDDQRRACDWGWTNFSGESDTDGTRRIQRSLRDKYNGDTWKLDRLTEDDLYPNVMYRFQDMNGYIGLSPTPFKFELNQTTISSNQALRVTMQDIEELLHIHKWGWFNGIDRNKIGFAVFITEITSGTPSPLKDTTSQFDVALLAGGKAGFTIEDFVTELGEKGFTISSALLSSLGITTSGDYCIIPFLISDCSPYTPDANGKITLNNTEVGAFLFPQDRLVFTLDATSTGGIISLDSVVVELVEWEVEDNMLNWVKINFYKDSANQGNSVASFDIDIKVVTGITSSGNNIYAYSSSKPDPFTADGNYTYEFTNVQLDNIIGTIGRIYAEISITPVTGTGWQPANGEKRLGNVSNK